LFQQLFKIEDCRRPLDPWIPGSLDPWIPGSLDLIGASTPNQVVPAAVWTRGIGLAASAGGLAALSQILSSLPAGFPAAILVVQHLDQHHRSWLVDILRRRVRLEVDQARGGERLAPGRIFIAPPGHHMLLEAGCTLALTCSARVRFVRPSADLLFASMAEHLGERAVAVVLTGTGSDGADGVRAVKLHGGTVIVQDGASEFDGMPRAARPMADRVLPLTEIAGALIDLIGLPAVETRH
jgi:two-component system chemotaxis response regulator CheB